MNLNQLLKKPLNKIPIGLAIFFLAIALVGFIDAGYLTVEHYQGKIPPCSTASGCEQVLTSPYAVMFGIPVSLAGLVYYLLVLVGIFGYLESRNTKFLKFSMLLSIIGFLASLGFVYLQVFIIRSYCLYCLGSAITSTILFVTSMEIFARYKKVQE